MEVLARLTSKCQKQVWFVVDAAYPSLPLPMLSLKSSQALVLNDFKIIAMIEHPHIGMFTYPGEATSW